MAKTNKSATKRLKLTSRGKVLKRAPGHDHFNAKASRSSQLNKKGWQGFAPADIKAVKRLLAN